ncbi:acetyl-CoA synthetase [Nematocida sp. AWRm79]|nr:acetyl-CoA synthetase [Nematocida sp. AWRm79]
MKEVYAHGRKLRAEYNTQYVRSIEHKEDFFKEQAKILLNFSKDFTTVYTEDQESCRIKWFEDGEINACYNAVDRHALTNPDKIAIIYEDDNENILRITYKELLQQVLIYSDYLISKGITMGDTVCIYMPMEPNALIISLSCARLGISHTVVFGGFSAESLSVRMEDSDSVWLITSDYTYRGGKKIDYLNNVINSIEILKNNVKNPLLKGILIFNKENISGEIFLKLKNSVNTVDTTKNIQNNQNLSITDIPCVPVPSEHTLFHLYTSGSTGKPKGLSHSTAGYLLYAALTTLVCFDIQDNDIFFCTAELGWITGHSYVLYGPLTLGITTVVFGGVPVYPDALRLFRSINKIKPTHLYTAPTVIRLLQKSLPDYLVKPYDITESNNELSPAVDHVPNSPISNRSIFTHGITDRFNKDNYYKKYKSDELDRIDISSLRVLGSVGEPINKGAYVWFSMYFGNGNIPIIDTYWQTEAGGVMLSPLISISEYKPESASFPFFGMQPIVMKKDGPNSTCSGNTGSASGTSGVSSTGSAGTSSAGTSSAGISGTSSTGISSAGSASDAGTSSVGISSVGTSSASTSSDGVVEVVGETGILLFKGFWPGIARTIVKNHDRYKSAYFQYKGYFYTGDEVLKDINGYYWIRGRIDDVINVAGHRLSTAEIESVVCSVTGVSEAAALGEEDEVTGQGVTIFIVKSGDVSDSDIFSDIKTVLRKRIGSVVNPKRIISCPELPKTSTGKMMRRVLRKILEGQEVGDISTCINPDSITFAKSSIAK